MRIYLCVSFFLITFLSANAQIYIAPNGTDKNLGSYSQPVASFKKAQQLVRKYSDTKPIHVVFKAGVYYLPETIKFTPADNKKSAVIYEAEKEGTVVISGGRRLQLQWKPFDANIYVADVPGVLSMDQLFVNGERQYMARYPNVQPGMNVFDAWELNHSIKKDSLNDVLLPSRIEKWENPQGAYLHAMHNYLWGDMHWLVKGKKENGELLLDGGWQNNRPSPMHPVYRMVENVFEELDAPGEWYFNAAEHKLFYYPARDVNLQTAIIEVVRLKHLIELNGNSSDPVKNIHFKGFVFKHTTRTFMENKEPLQRSDWTVYRGGAMVFNGAENCSVTDSEFDRVGGNTIFVNNYNRHITIKGCYIHHSGASGVLFVGDSAAVRSPLYGYVKRNYAMLDTVKGPRSNNYPSDCLVEDCLITLTGRDEKQTAGVQISLSANIRINHCSIYDMPRAGINISEGAFGGHIIENSEIFNTVLETGDHGSFNSWGRDRYWTPNGKDVAKEIEKKPELYLLDITAPNIIRHNRWRCDYGWDIDLDDGSSHYRIYNNVLLNSGLKLREGYDRIVTNNIILNNSLHPHVWYPNSGDVFKNNIVFGAYRPAIMNSTIPADGKWGSVVDFNYFVCDSAQMHRFLKNGCDIHSSNGDPMFVDAAMGNYQVKENSDALKIGFQNFSTTSFGVHKASLKAIAKQPVLPQLNLYANPQKTSSAKAVKWMGAMLYEPQGDELSAYGVGFNEGGIALVQIDPDSPLIQMGFKTGDLIQVVNGVSVKSIPEFLKLFNKPSKGDEICSYTLFRNQQRQNLLVKEQFQ
jgi:hypothetical protein